MVAAALLAAVVVATSTAIEAQTLTPSYLSDMPAPERILNEIKGKNAEDTIERQMGAFQALNKMIDDMAWGLEKRYLPRRATPDENRVKDTYSLAYADLWHRASNKEDHLYDHDRELLGELLTKFFSQGFRDLYARSDANAVEYYKAYRARMSGTVLTVGPAGQAPAQPAKQPPSAPAKPAAPATPTGGTKYLGVDPSIAKAKAAKVDLTAFGLTFGQPVQLPQCADELLRLDKRACITGLPANAAAALDFLNAVMPGALDGGTVDPNVMQVRFDEAHCPSWVVQPCEAQVLLQDGVLVAIAVNTNGRKVENSVNTELRGKYGPPSVVKEGRITPDEGNAFDVKDPEWILPGLHVEYQVVVHNEAVGVDRTIGFVRVMTESAYQRIVNKPVKKKM